MLIAFIHSGKAFLPELAAYTHYFSAKGIECEVVKPEELPLLEPDVAWHFMGTSTQKLPGVLSIHEYTSASVSYLKQVRNTVKKLINVQPDYRLFLNRYVQDQFMFRDHVPFGYRDMGVPPGWLDASPAKERSGFVYAGELKGRNIKKLLDVFATGPMQGQPLLVLSREYAQLARSYEDFSNIEFRGPLPHDEVRYCLQASAFGLNFIPDEEPYNRQTSTKLLEYSACKLPVISTDYAWIRQFRQEHGGDYFFLKADLSNFTPEQVNGFHYSFPDLSGWTWEKQIEKSGVVEFLGARFPEVID
jgi:glycosyltransferase involved in cell wall biosynthesis